MNELPRAPRWARWLCLVALCLTVCFIWSNSLRDATHSSEQSGWVSQFLQAHFPVDRPPMSFIYQNLRKVAHFTEFALLGAETAMSLLCWGRRRPWQGCLGLLFCVACAALDETIQLFVPGRVGAVRDVCIDSAGAGTGMLLVYTVFAIALCLRRHHRA